jgi:hypothetical protein
VTFRRRFAIFLLCLLPTTVPAIPQGSPSPAHTPAAKAGWSEFAANLKAMHMAMSSVGSSGNSDAAEKTDQPIARTILARRVHTAKGLPLEDPYEKLAA